MALVRSPARVALMNVFAVPPDASGTVALPDVTVNDGAVGIPPMSVMVELHAWTAM
jgi:hypothetical protein